MHYGRHLLKYPEVTEKEKLDRSKTDRYALYKIGPVLSISVSRVYLYIQSAGFYQ